MNIYDEAPPVMVRRTNPGKWMSVCRLCPHYTVRNTQPAALGGGINHYRQCHAHYGAWREDERL